MQWMRKMMIWKVLRKVLRINALTKTFLESNTKKIMKNIPLSYYLTIDYSFTHSVPYILKSILILYHFLNQSIGQSMFINTKLLNFPYTQQWSCIILELKSLKF